MEDLTDRLTALIHRASTRLPDDVLAALTGALEAEAPRGTSLIQQILENCQQAARAGTPICQDTGTPLFYVEYGPEWREAALRSAIEEATRRATAAQLLRPNAVEAISGRNSGDGTGLEVPVIHCQQRDEAGVRVRLLLKGGGSENASSQYRLPDESLRAGRDLEGVRRVVLHAVHQVQGTGCAPAILGIGIGGDRITSMAAAKEQLFRPLDDRHPDPRLAALEKRLLAEINTLGIGPMGCGGRTTALAVKAAGLHRHPASFFVSISYMCWALRRAQLDLHGNQATITQ